MTTLTTSHGGRFVAGDLLTIDGDTWTVRKVLSSTVIDVKPATRWNRLVWRALAIWREVKWQCQRAWFAVTS